MRTSLFILLFSLFTFSISGCQKDKIDAQPKEIKLTEDQQLLLEETSGFSFDLFREIAANADDDANVFISPLSVSLALAMAYNGAEGTTRQAMHETLQLPDLTVKQVNEAYSQLLNDLTSVDKKVILTIANSVWYRESFQVNAPFLEATKTYYDAEVRALDFSRPDATTIINNWVSLKTNQLIRKIIDNISNETMMYIMNAIYFKGEWKYGFDMSESGPDAFYLEDSGFQQVRMMRQQTTLSYYSDEVVSVAELPYGRGNYSMMVVLPHGGVSMDQTMAYMSNDTWQQITSNQLVPVKLDLKLPAMKFAFEQKLKPALTNMGMGDAFVPFVADFSGINPANDLHISEVIHKAFVDINEEGTEAAAVTAVEFGVTSVGPGNNMTIFHANRPFLFFIREKYTNTVIFAARIMMPVIE
jgi:serine protease inhibitor